MAINLDISTASSAYAASGASASDRQIGEVRQGVWLLELERAMLDMGTKLKSEVKPDARSEQASFGRDTASTAQYQLPGTDHRYADKTESSMNLLDKKLPADTQQTQRSDEHTNRINTGSKDASRTSSTANDDKRHDDTTVTSADSMQQAAMRTPTTGDLPGNDQAMQEGAVTAQAAVIANGVSSGFGQLAIQAPLAMMAPSAWIAGQGQTAAPGLPIQALAQGEAIQTASAGINSVTATASNPTATLLPDALSGFPTLAGEREQASTSMSLDEEAPFKGARDDASMREGEAYGRRQLHLYYGKDGVQAWIRDADLAASQAGSVAQALSAGLVGAGVRLTAVTLNGQKLAELSDEKQDDDSHAEPASQQTKFQLSAGIVKKGGV